jgi:hypothetical protein
VVENTLTIQNYSVNVLINPGSTHSYINRDCACHFGWDGLKLPYTLLVSTPLGKSVEAGKYISGCVIKEGKEKLPRYFIEMPFEDYDLILEMDWLSEYHDRVDCKEKLVQFVRPKKHVLEFEGNRVKELKYLISGAKKDVQDIWLIWLTSLRIKALWRIW